MDRNGNMVYHVFGAASPRIYGPTYERLPDAALSGTVEKNCKTVLWFRNEGGIMVERP